jgi:hypothetical protein
MPRRKAKDTTLGDRELTEALRRLGTAPYSGGEVPDGEAKTQAEALAKLVWMFALGYTAECEDEEGRLVSKYTPPQKWAIDLVFKRIEGKEAAAEPTSKSRKMSAADKIAELAQQRINSLAMEATEEGDA